MAELNAFFSQAEADHYEASNKGSLDSATLESRTTEMANKRDELAAR